MTAILGLRCLATVDRRARRQEAAAISCDAEGPRGTRSVRFPTALFPFSRQLTCADLEPLHLLFPVHDVRKWVVPRFTRTHQILLGLTVHRSNLPHVVSPSTANEAFQRVIGRNALFALAGRECALELWRCDQSHALSGLRFRGNDPSNWKYDDFPSFYRSEGRDYHRDDRVGDPSSASERLCRAVRHRRPASDVRDCSRWKK